MKVFFTADMHFCENDNGISVLIRDRRPFKNIKQMDKTIVKNFNKQATKEDIIFVVGDFCNYNMNDLNSWEKGFNIVKKIHAKVILIFGNQEDRILEKQFNGNFDEFKKYLLNVGFYEIYKQNCLVKIDNFEYFLTHKPLNCNSNYFNLFGHIHSTCLLKSFGINVGVDCNYFKLCTLDDIKQLKYQLDNYCDDNVLCESI